MLLNSKHNPEINRSVSNCFKTHSLSPSNAGNMVANISNMTFKLIYLFLTKCLWTIWDDVLVVRAYLPLLSRRNPSPPSIIYLVIFIKTK